MQFQKKISYLFKITIASYSDKYLSFSHVYKHQFNVLGLAKGNPASSAKYVP